MDRHDEIQSFVPEPYWYIVPTVEYQGRHLKLSWERKRVFDQQVGIYFCCYVHDF